ncbi:BQ5605_C004g02986 [Microbotryum silenes-dioicae]|uniref:BQ5605_C004g02986 protein n=1 Tax=Microbotryum silenes-dioicae TaxID=796604 RepID=A0A2X0PBE3_9BASI|nr:BQ5605_C004g02986 [Microbotryum silenes-dioicae]
MIRPLHLNPFRKPIQIRLLDALEPGFVLAHSRELIPRTPDDQGRSFMFLDRLEQGLGVLRGFEERKKGEDRTRVRNEDRAGTEGETLRDLCKRGCGGSC